MSDLDNEVQPGPSGYARKRTKNIELWTKKPCGSLGGGGGRGLKNHQLPQRGGGCKLFYHVVGKSVISRAYSKLDFGWCAPLQISV